MTRVIPVLLYHRVADGVTADSFAVSRDQFIDHIATIKATGRVPLTISEVADALRQPSLLPERPIAITFDDGYTDTLSAIDLLCSIGLRATVYVTTGDLGTGERIGVRQVRALAERSEGIELGAHTVSHRRLDELGPHDARKEIAESKRMLELIIDRRVDTFAYPHGAYDTQSRALVIEAGFRSAAATKNALSHAADDPWAIARWTVRSATTVDEVTAVVTGNARPLAWTNERLRTRAYRYVRRFRPAQPPETGGHLLRDDRLTWRDRGG